MSAILRRWRAVLSGPHTWGVAGERSVAELPRGGARGSAWLAVAALVVALVATPFGVDLGGSEFGRLVDGALQSRSADGWRHLEAPATVPAGAELRVGARPATIEIDGAVLTLSPDTRLHADPEAPRVRGGGLLVEAEQPSSVRVGATTARGRGQWRVDVGIASRVATYRGRVELDDGIAQRRVDRFRQVSVRDGALEPGTRPLRYSADDPWDTWLLADALAVDRLGTRLRDALERRYGEEPRGAGFYAAFVTVADAGIDDDLHELAVTVDGARFGPPGDVLVGVAAVDALATEAGDTPAEALERVVALRRAGATWGLVLVEHDLGPAALRAAADRALRQVEATPPPGPGPDEATGAVAPVDAVAPTQPAPAVDGEETEPAPVPGPGPQPPDDGGGDDDPLDPVEDAVGDGDDDGLPDPVEDAVDDTGDSVGDLLEDTTDIVGDSVGDLREDTTDSVGDSVGDVGSLLDGPGSSRAGGSDDEVERGGLPGR